MPTGAKAACLETNTSVMPSRPTVLLYSNVQIADEGVLTGVDLPPRAATGLSSAWSVPGAARGSVGAAPKGDMLKAGGVKVVAGEAATYKNTGIGR